MSHSGGEQEPVAGFSPRTNYYLVSVEARVVVASSWGLQNTRSRRPAGSRKPSSETVTTEPLNLHGRLWNRWRVIIDAHYSTYADALLLDDFNTKHSARGSGRDASH